MLYGVQAGVAQDACCKASVMSYDAADLDQSTLLTPTIAYVFPSSPVLSPPSQKAEAAAADWASPSRAGHVPGPSLKL
jgi:hypothetical protein